MKLFMIKTMVFIVSLIPTMKTPMSMGILLLIQTTLTTLMLTKVMNSSWMSMVIFLMLIGGLLILFMYMSSIASNEKFTSKMIMYLPMILMIIPLEDILSELQINDSLKMYAINESLSLTKIYNKKTMMITMMLFSYLLLAMISITKIIKVYKGPLRPK